VTGVQTCALPIDIRSGSRSPREIVRGRTPILGQSRKRSDFVGTAPANDLSHSAVQHTAFELAGNRPNDGLSTQGQPTARTHAARPSCPCLRKRPRWSRLRAGEENAFLYYLGAKA